MSAYSYKRYFNTDKFIIVLFNITTPEASINPSFIERGDSQAQKETSTSVSPVTTLYTKAQLQVWREPFWPASRLDLHKSISSPDCPGMQWEPTQEICELYMFLHLVQAFHLQIWPQSLKQLPLIGPALLSYGLFSGKSKYAPQISVNVAQHKPLKLFKTLRDSFKKKLYYLILECELCRSHLSQCQKAGHAGQRQLCLLENIRPTMIQILKPTNHKYTAFTQN